MAVKHVLGISGGKDSAALAIYLKDRHPELDIEYYTCDTGRELDETYELIEKLESYLGKKIVLLQAVKPKVETPYDNTFDHFLDQYGGYLPSSNSRWCTKKLKLEPFENYIGDEPTISYVGIRGDEDREGYISKKPNVQSIFPFRKNIWSEDVIKLVLNAKNIKLLSEYYLQVAEGNSISQALAYIDTAISECFSMKQKLNALLDVDTTLFNKAVFQFLKTTDYPVGKLDHFPLIGNEDIIKLEDVFRTLQISGIGIPAYYKERVYEVEINGELKQGKYARSRSGCFFCFFQQKIEWVWLLENHPMLFEKAKEYEKDGYTWMDNETLSELERPERVEAVKKEHYIRAQRSNQKRTTNSWKNEIIQAEGIGCASCFI